jgi:hypothetical protein
MAPKKDTVTVRFPTFEEIIKMNEFDGVDGASSAENIYVKVESADGHTYFSFTADCLGKDVVLSKTKDGGYSDNKDFTINDDEVSLFHKVVKVIAGTPVDPPIDIEGDALTYDKSTKTFECGCKTIDLKQADEIFRFIGDVLGYTIT